MQYNRLKLTIRSRAAFERNEFDQTVPYAAISITDPDDPPVSHKHARCRGILRLCFDGTEDDGPLCSVPYTREMATQVAQFVRALPPDVVHLVIHCTAGVSRSAGIAAALSTDFFRHDGDIGKTHLPDYQVYEITLRALTSMSDREASNV